jgi:hypothetical protein
VILGIIAYKGKQAVIVAGIIGLCTLVVISLAHSKVKAYACVVVLFKGKVVVVYEASALAKGVALSGIDTAYGTLEVKSEVFMVGTNLFAYNAGRSVVRIFPIVNALNTASVAKVVCKEAVLAKLTADIAAVKSCINAKAELVNTRSSAIFTSTVYKLVGAGCATLLAGVSHEIMSLKLLNIRGSVLRVADILDENISRLRNMALLKHNRTTACIRPSLTTIKREGDISVKSA